ncbi:winged helix-turn-helix transcriptional regulator [Vibrio spartinae]|uniref:HTH-type transcriptional regulator YtcD n=1 Tax=Vibrio spartinae TaxID=1918945 RepID=A0A1N6M601_9VIBR|nr:helix-turn-helix domain-containing protein [Vibrio spartinae]QMV14873.1 putative HTH-type transcriptional regulator YtcD [Vibrio spartinae]SIO94849.1 putative HTH-type transcriptional regulator YtcD [Vibrio spartinae]
MKKTSQLEQYQRGNVFIAQCPSREVLNHITSRWGILVLVALNDGARHRFSGLKKRITGISEKMLSQTLQTLERDGFLTRIAYPVVPPHVEYQLTQYGHTVTQKAAILVEWLEDNIIDIQRIQSRYDQARMAHESSLQAKK